MSNFIKVSRQRYLEIFKGDKFKEEIVPIEGGCSYREYTVKDENGKIVGKRGEGSWECPHYVIEELCDPAEVIKHYRNLYKQALEEIEDRKKAYKKLADYKKLSILGKIKFHYQEWKQKRWDKKHPGLYEYLEEGYVFEYDPSADSIGEIEKHLKNMFDEN